MDDKSLREKTWDYRVKKIQDWINLLDEKEPVRDLIELIEQPNREHMTGHDREYLWNLILDTAQNIGIKNCPYSGKVDALGYYPCEMDPDGNLLDAAWYADHHNNDSYSEHIYDAYLEEDISALIEIMKNGNDRDKDWAAQVIHTFVKGAVFGQEYNVQNLTVDDIKEHSDSFIELLDDPVQLLRVYLIQILGDIQEVKAIPKLVSLMKNGSDRDRLEIGSVLDYRFRTMGEEIDTMINIEMFDL
tara:strand:- start:37 stop:771 length:735 start_codon:yes stop_codon:yes gene_type:complete